MMIITLLIKTITVIAAYIHYAERVAINYQETSYVPGYSLQVGYS